MTHAWWRAGSLLPTTLAGVEIGLLTIFLVLRSTDLVQLAVSVPGGLRSSTAPALDGGLMVAYLAESVAIAVVSIRRRRFLSAPWTAVDLTVATVVMVAQPWFTAEATRIGTWVAWGYPVGVGAALAAGVGFPRRGQTLTAVTVLVGAYLAVSLPAVRDSGELATVWSNTFAFPAFGLFGRLLSSYLRRLGRDADQARADAAQAAAQAMLDRHRLLLHDQATVLRLLAQPGLDPALAGLLRSEAAAAAGRIRIFLGDARGVADPVSSTDLADRSVADTVLQAASGFGDLPLTISVDLAASVVLDDERAKVLGAAVCTVLHNVRVHAHARQVIVHADGGPGGSWEVTVNDDGVGFDPADQEWGFGLRRQVMAEVQRIGACARIDSRPGQGTTITITDHGTVGR
ncbi:hypothetical protein FDO65_08240 [Nakamurella flava]|uniref:ATP-binding protein n=1 Tax=Nakamurella flava TaxID=2576308 RepID=A0A4U6QLV2_9ACTN|nr:hypothetical protein [Nakamurella flava]TKV61544.1 hypothetical protein FDO65_08240 [Nakamurella flava]